MNVNQVMKQIYGIFRQNDFYQGMVQVDECEANIFVIEQIAQEIKEEETQKFWIDATFNISPIFFSQLLVILVEIESNVKSMRNNMYQCNISHLFFSIF